MINEGSKIAKQIVIDYNREKTYQERAKLIREFEKRKKKQNASKEDIKEK